MDLKTFSNFISNIEQLNTRQYKSLKESLKELDDKKRNAINLQKTNQLFCPHCRSKRFIKWGVRHDLQRYKCKECLKTFNPLTSTPLARLKKKGRWLAYSECIKAGLSVRKAAQICKVNKNTTFKWRHRFLSNAKVIKPKSVRGIVEIKEIYFPYSEKGQKKNSKQKDLNKRKKTCVLIVRDRNKNTFDSIIKKLNKNQLRRYISPRLDKDVLLCSDAKPSYISYANENQIRHGKINQHKGIYVVKDIVHLNNTSTYQVRLKTWMFRFRGVVTKYLDSYLAWFRQLDEFNMQISSLEILLRAKSTRPYYHQP